MHELWWKYATRAPRNFENQGFFEEELMILDYIGKIVKDTNSFKLMNTVNADKTIIAANLYKNISKIPDEDLLEFAKEHNIDCIKILEDNNGNL